MTIKIVTVGSKPSNHLNELIDDYITRMPSLINCKWQYIKHGSGNSENSKQQESETILRHLDDKSLVFLLDENGAQYRSEEFSDLIFRENKNLIFVIGGAYGVDDRVKQRANYIISFSKMVMPHQIVRLLLTEQIYRAYCISINHPYHHS